MNSSKSINYFILSFMIIILIVNEWLIPLNHYIPKIYLLFQSLSDFWKEYKLIEDLLTSFFTIIFSYIISFLILISSIPLIYKWKDFINSFLKTLGFLKYFPSLFLIFIFFAWFPNSIFTTFLFTIIISLSLLINYTLKNLNSFENEFLIPAFSLSTNKIKTSNLILRKGFISPLIKELININKYIWILLIIFEYVRNIEPGVGYLIKLSIELWNINYLFTNFILVALLILLSEFMLKYLRKKIFYWE